MLAAAREIVTKAGMTVRVEDLSLEQVIQHGPDWLGGTAFDEQTIAVVTQIVADNRHRLGTAAGRREVLCEAVHQGVRRNLQAVVDSRERQIFTALVATLDSLRDSDVRRRVQTELERTEINLLTRMTAFYGDITTAPGWPSSPPPKAGSPK